MRQTKSGSGDPPKAISLRHPRSEEFEGELILNACGHILQDENLNLYTFVEIAAEPGQFVLSEVNHPFHQTKIIRLGDPLDIPPAIVYSNEWLDAQAFKRFLFNPEDGKWQEKGVTLENGSFRETAMACPFPKPLVFPRITLNLI